MSQISNNQQSKQKRVGLSKSILLAILGISSIVFLCYTEQANASIGYFENYGWPTYGIVKPFWMTPFSAFPSRSISGYSRKHPIHNGRGIVNYNGY